MQRAIRIAIWGLALTGMAGCGSASTATDATKAKVLFKSPAVVDGKLQARYTCDGSDVSPPLEWSGVPATAKELALLVVGLTPSTNNTSEVSIEWALAGIPPGLHRLGAGEIPPGAHAGSGTHGKRYSICPRKGKAERYKFALYVVPSALTVPASFTGLELLRTLATQQSPARATAGAILNVSYKRK